MKLYEENKKLIAGSTSKNIILKDTLDKEQNLHLFAKGFDYTVIMFYAPTCEHCQVEAPQMDSTIEVLEKRYNISIGKYAICNESGIPASIWKKFILENKLNNNYVHVQLPDGNTVRSDYGAYSNPMSFLIGRNGEMLAKKISPLSLRNTINSIINQDRVN
jgi:thiol-disulfide isomerase/thioredoxin